MCSPLQATASRVAEPRLLKDLALPKDWQHWQAFRVERPQASLALQITLEKAGALRLVLRWGVASVIVADLRDNEGLDLSKLSGWSRCRLSERWHAECPVLFDSLPPAAKGKGATGTKRGPVKGWSAQSRHSNWQILEALGQAGVITAGITVGQLPETERLRNFQHAIQKRFERDEIAHFGNWEGPRPHTHWIFCSRLPPGFESEFASYCKDRYRYHFPGHALPDKLVDIDTELRKGQQAVARYYSKVDKFGIETKSPGACPWLKWFPYWHHHLPWWLLDPIIEKLPKTPPEVIARAIRRRMK